MIASVVASLVAHGTPPEQIGVVTPYSAQAIVLSQILQGAGSQGAASLAGVEVSSIDGFQGREKEVILFSCVRSNPSQRLGFLADHRRLNVAITRARRGLIVVGDERTLGADDTWRAYLQYLRMRACVIKADAIRFSAWSSDDR